MAKLIPTELNRYVMMVTLGWTTKRGDFLKYCCRSRNNPIARALQLPELGAGPTLDGPAISPLTPDKVRQDLGELLGLGSCPGESAELVRHSKGDREETSTASGSLPRGLEARAHFSAAAYRSDRPGFIRALLHIQENCRPSKRLRIVL